MVKDHQKFSDQEKELTIKSMVHASIEKKKRWLVQTVIQEDENKTSNLVKNFAKSRHKDTGLDASVASVTLVDSIERMEQTTSDTQPRSPDKKRRKRSKKVSIEEDETFEENPNWGERFKNELSTNSIDSDTRYLRDCELSELVDRINMYTYNIFECTEKEQGSKIRFTKGHQRVTQKSLLVINKCTAIFITGPILQTSSNQNYRFGSRMLYI